MGQQEFRRSVGETEENEKELNILSICNNVIV